MVQTNKILTVSYGTFSCTLEGFDESFETMKAIAEYFRDLAGDDRYFGAEPPTPDAEMLARIAEREISRRVEAHTGEDGIVLRPSLADATMIEPRAVENAPQAEPEGEAVPEVEARFEEDVTPVEAEAEAEVEPEAVEELTEAETAVDVSDTDGTSDDEILEEAADDSDEINVEDDLTDLVADVAEETSQEADEALEEVSQQVGEALEQADEAVEESAQAAEDAIAEAAKESEDAIQQAEDALEEAAMALTDEMSDAVDSEVEEVEQHAADAGNSIADKLRRIRDVVGIAAVTPDVAAEEPKEEPSEVTEAVDEELDAASLMDNVMATLGSDETTDQTEEKSDAKDEAEENLTETLAADDNTNVGQSASDEVDEADQTDTPAEEINAPPIRISPRRPVRVVKVKRRSVEPADEGSSLVEKLVATPDESAGDSSLSVEDEADLQRELAQLEEEIESPAKTEVTEEPPVIDEALADEAARAVRSLARRDRLENFGEDDSDMSRLMAETDEQLNEPGGRNRRNAIAHLRAAVAATRADRTDGNDTASDPRDAYRDDLAQAVRPRRGAQPGGNGDTPRVAPLKLVAEQRIDVPGEDSAMEATRQAAQAVRPRRVSLADDDGIEETPGGFAAFAEERGANRLPDLLEAAASYMSFVEGRQRFSRPQLMNKVRQIEELDTSREDRLRSFGQLLREGKIEKVEGGRFTASENIGFKPGKRAAG